MTSPIFVSPIERPRRVVQLIGLCCALLRAGLANAQTEPNTPPRLPELPAIPSLELPKPIASELEELDTRLAKLCSEDPTERDAARREVLEARLESVPAIRFRLAASAESAKRDELKQLLLEIRKKGRDSARDEQESEGKRGKLTTPDYLEMVSEHAQPKSKQWCALISVLAESRMLSQIGSVEAVRGLIEIYVKYGEFLRVDTQLRLEALGDRAVPALIEAQRYPSEKIAKWAGRELDALGKAIPSEAVQVNDLQVLADVLRAYGRVRDPDAARIVISFSNSERAQVREASRQAIAMLGEVGAWQLRDMYETVVGKKPPRDWNWERTARELFGEFDRLRSAEVSKLYEAGIIARERGDWEAMRKAFDQVLARNPEYPKQEELARAYLDYALRVLPQSAPDALPALRRAERLGKSSPIEKSATSLRLTLEAEALADAGIVDRTLLARAIDADPKNARAARALSRLEPGETSSDDPSPRYYAAGAIALAALVGIVMVLLRRGRPEAASTARTHLTPGEGPSHAGGPVAAGVPEADELGPPGGGTNSDHQA